VRKRVIAVVEGPEGRESGQAGHHRSDQQGPGDLPEKRSTGGSPVGIAVLPGDAGRFCHGSIISGRK
jgi:hypothetical protein